MALSITPRKSCTTRDICISCGFCFKQKEVTADGYEVVHKFYDVKLKLNEERTENIRKVTGVVLDRGIDDVGGVCKKCYRTVESVLKSEEKNNGIKKTLADSIKKFNGILDQQLPHGREVEKRQMRSPDERRPQKSKTLEKDVVPFFDLTNLPVHMNKFVPIQMKEQTETVEGQKHVPLQSQDSIERKENELTEKPKKPLKRSLHFGLESLPLDGSIEVTIYYPSGEKTSVIMKDTHKKICKALVRDTNVEETVVNILCQSNPTCIINGACQIIRSEGRNVSKRGSGCLLQKKDYDDLFSFRWEHLHEDLHSYCPSILSVIQATVSDITPSVNSKAYHHILLTAAIGLHGRSQEMSSLQYITGIILKHGGCKERDIERLSKIGLAVHPVTIHRKLKSWQNMLDTEILQVKESWAHGNATTYQIIGDNWDKDILPSYRTSDRKTESLHLFNLYAIIDRVTFSTEDYRDTSNRSGCIDPSTFIPSMEEQRQLKRELCFLISSAVIENHPQMNKIFGNVYPKHLEHAYSRFAGEKTKQFPLGLRDCNENKTQDMIKLLKDLSAVYVSCKDDTIVEPVFFGGDRLTDERVQSAQEAMKNADTPLERLEGFVSKIEDFHRLMNFLGAIHKMNYNTQSGSDRCTAYYFRNLLDLRNVKGKVCNSFRAYKMLYYLILDALCVLMFLKVNNLEDIDKEIDTSNRFENMSNAEKIAWMDNISEQILERWFMEGSTDISKDLRDVICDPNHPDNYWISNLQEDGRLGCHHCPKTYKHSSTLQYHEKKVHDVNIEIPSSKKKKEEKDEVFEYIVMLFKLTLLLKNLDSGIDMGDGERVVRSAKYELPIYNSTNKIKYMIGSIHLTALSSEVLPVHQQKRLVANRFVNIQEGKNNNISLDEFLEMLNRDSKDAASGHQTKESILQNSKDYPRLIHMKDHYEEISGIKKKKGFHHLPSYKSDVIKILNELNQQNVLIQSGCRKLSCRGLNPDRDLFTAAYKGLRTMIHRHVPQAPFRRLRDPHV